MASRLDPMFTQTARLGAPVRGPRKIAPQPLRGPHPGGFKASVNYLPALTLGPGSYNRTQMNSGPTQRMLPTFDHDRSVA